MATGQVKTSTALSFDQVLCSFQVLYPESSFRDRTRRKAHLLVLHCIVVHILLLAPDLLQTSSRPPPDLLQTSSRPPPDLLQTYSRPTPDLLQTYSRPTPDLLQTYSRPTPDLLQTYSRPPDGEQLFVMNPALLLLLAVAASQMDLNSAAKTNVRPPGGVIDISSCPITYYGKQYTSLNMTFTLRNYHPAATGSEMFADSDQGVLDSSKSTADLDLSGCRVSGVAVVGGSEMPHPENCTATACALNTDVTEVNKCGPFEVCGGNSTCYFPPVMCTVTGSTVIGVSGAVHSVQDRCAYSLMEPQGSASFNLMAAFRERRRTDVPLLDHLILLLPGAPDRTIYLEQGGRVRVGDEALVLNSTAQQHHGVELSKDQTGVTANILDSHTTVYFDGNSAHVTGLTEALGGLCGNPLNPTLPTTPASQKSIAFSPSGCETQYQDSVNISINCNRSTDHCNLMRQPPFSSCHEHTDPEPYISACTHTLCRYPSADGVDCQFLEAYAKACSLEANVTLEDWSDAGLLQPVGPNTEILLNQKVWLQLEAGGLDANLVAIVTDSCWATNQASPDSNLRYDLIIKGCPNPADDTVQMQGNGQGTSSVFSFDMFEFSGASNEIYLHCKLELCPTQGQACAPSCGGGACRRRRAAEYAEGNAALITMGWRN
ncbi:hypothetical protein NQZ68_012774 [Dissostichus eleginoides]|nr:hypothetical protein NQZ68_012774 [Dissostichus eleginoides]